MKLSVAIVAVVLVASACGDKEKWKEMKEKRHEMMKECMEQTGITKEEFKNSRKNPDHKAKCTIQCVAEKSGWTNGDGNIDIEKVVEKLGGKEKLIEAARQCYEKITDHEKCNEAYELQTCFMKSAGMGKHGGKGGRKHKGED